MSGRADATWTRSAVRADWEVVGPLLLVVPLELLAFSDTSIGVSTAISVAVAVAAVAIVCNHPRWPGARTLGTMAAIAGAGILTATSAPTLTTEVLAAAAGILILYSLARGAAPAGRRSTVHRALTLPAASVGIALSTGLLLVPGESVAGLTAVLVVGAVAAVAYLLGEPAPPSEAQPAAS